MQWKEIQKKYKETKVAEWEKKLSKLLANKNEMYISEIAKTLKTNDTIVRKYVDILEKEGFVKTRQYGWMRMVGLK